MISEINADMDATVTRLSYSTSFTLNAMVVKSQQWTQKLLCMAKKQYWTHF
jgi:hypothetical protein